MGGLLFKMIFKSCFYLTIKGEMHKPICKLSVEIVGIWMKIIICFLIISLSYLFYTCESNDSSQYFFKKHGFNYTTHQLKNLEKLNLSSLDIKANELAQLEKLKKLKVLNLESNLLTDESLIHLKNLKNLEKLFLAGTGITDKGLIYIKDLKNLNVIDISYNNITDEGLIHLNSLTNLKKNYLL